ncbi:hypothetical protein FQR65_LT01700 [Abscondita terminalis]|nr:hypothetical protein FQR65_LT01700 [Abscondita terminalis]
MLWQKISLPFSLRRMFSGMASLNPSSISNDFHQKAVRVAVLGADTLTGEMVAYLLKQNPIVSQIYLYGDSGVFGISADLRHFDTRCEVKGYSGRSGLGKSLRRADIVILVGSDKCSINADPETRLRSELDTLVTYTNACAKYAPKSLIAVCTRINSLIGAFQELDPKCVHVPIIGGPDTDNVVPLLSRALPASVLPCDVEEVYKKIKNWKESTSTKCEPKAKVTDCRLSEAYSINQLVTTMALGLCRDDYAIATAFVRQNIIPTCKYLVTTVQFGPNGVIHNFGIPRLTKFELAKFEKATNQLKSLEEMALRVLNLTNAAQNE